MIRLPDESDNSLALADWVELSLLVSSNDVLRISDAEIVGELTDAALDAEGDRGNIAAEIARRSAILGDVYPFFRDGQGFSVNENWREQLPYAFLLLLSSNQYYGELVYAGAANQPAKLFEYVSGQALASYVEGRFIRIGASREAPLPAPFGEAVQYASQQLLEESTYGQVEVQVGGDDGCDIMAWREFRDNRPGQIVIFGQCAIGTDWRDKRSELDLELWSKHINWHVRPTTAFCIPFVHEFGGTWRETSARGGVIFDRLRLAEQLQEGFSEELVVAVGTWCDQRLVTVTELSLEEA
ncbi:MAG: hypothetical protein ABJP34_03595 [Erythrobacter sp.]